MERQFVIEYHMRSSSDTENMPYDEFIWRYNRLVKQKQDEREPAKK